MPLVPAKCTQCGATLTLDPTQDAAVCPFCGTPFVVEKAINNYQVTNNTTIGTVERVEHLHVNDEHSIEARLASAEASLAKLGDNERAFAAFKSIADDKADEWRAWWGMARAKTRDFRSSALDQQQLRVVQDCMSRALAVAPDEVKSGLQQTIGTFFDARRQQELESYLQAFSDVDPQEVRRVDGMSARAMEQRFRELNSEVSQLEMQQRYRAHRGMENYGCLFLIGMPALVLVALVTLIAGFGGFASGTQGPTPWLLVACGAVAVALAVALGVSNGRKEAAKDQELKERREAAEKELEQLKRDLDLKKRLANHHSAWRDYYPSYEQMMDESTMNLWTGSYFDYD